METREQFLDRRLRQIQEGAAGAIRREVAWLRKHRFPVWVVVDGRVVDVSEREDPGRDP